VLVRRPDPAQRDDALSLRHRVFCVEQGVPLGMELDGRDDEALHLVALDGDAVIGTVRLVLDGPTAKLGRLAVARSARGRGIGSALVREAVREARDAGARRIALHAQVDARVLYEREGFAPYGPPFTEAGIAHVSMEKRL
jgi:ElaA protein